MYNILKIIHIFSATILLVSLFYCYSQWRYMQKPRFANIVFQRIQTQTLMLIIPSCLIQLMSGFTLFSLQHENFLPFLRKGSFIGFMVLMVLWLSFIYLLSLSQQMVLNFSPFSEQKILKYKVYRYLQAAILILCAATVSGMMFLMASIK